jgi:hypothetical protein
MTMSAEPILHRAGHEAQYGMVYGKFSASSSPGIVHLNLPSSAIAQHIGCTPYVVLDLA